MIRDSQPDGAPPFMLQPPRRLAGSLEQKGIRARSVRTQQPVLPIIDHCVLSDFGQIAAHQSKMVISIRLPNVADALQRRLVADMAAERIARIRGIHDYPAAAQSLDRLAHEAPLRGHRM